MKINTVYSKRETLLKYYDSYILKCLGDNEYNSKADLEGLLYAHDELIKHINEDPQIIQECFEKYKEALQIVKDTLTRAIAMDSMLRTNQNILNDVATTQEIYEIIWIIENIQSFYK